MDNIRFCPSCMEFVQTHLEVRYEAIKGINVTVSFSATVRVCNKCGNALFDRDLDDAIIKYARKLSEERKK